ncbi:MAG: hypothetical protein ACRELE_05340 [Gemmatimonadales bacterium]
MQVALGGIITGALLILAAYGSAWLPHGAPPWGVWCMITGSALLMSATMALGALRSGVGVARVTLLAAFLLVVIAAGFGAPLLLPIETATSPLLLGLPLRSAIETYGVGLLPVLVLPVLFAVEFQRDGLDDASLAALRQRGAELRGGGVQPSDN